MKTITVNLYKFNELSEEAKQATIEKYRDINVDYDGWHDFIIEEYTGELEALGYENITINYSGFWSQGDGASFTAATIDLWQWIKAHKLGNKYRSLKKWIDEGELVASIQRETHHYYHEKTVSSTVESGDCPAKLSSLIDELENELDEKTEDYCRELYKQLSNAYDSLTTDEAVAETLEANEYDFLAEGGAIQ